MTWHEHWERGNPEQIAFQQEARGTSFEERATHISPERVAQILALDKSLAKKLEAKGFPMDEHTCDDIGATVGLGAEEIAATSQYLANQKQRELH